jgi:hypothetical protein
MRENRTYGSEGGEAKAFPTPIAAAQQTRGSIGAALCKSLRMQWFLAPANLRALDAPNRASWP